MNNRIRILRTPVIEKNENNEFYVQDSLLQNLIEQFVFTLEKNISIDDLQALYNNLSTLKIDNRRIIYQLVSGIFKDNTVTGEYFLDDNVISVFPLKNNNILGRYIGINNNEYIANLYHELLHMSSTIRGRNKEIAFSGLSQVRTNNSIGVALDDGYTEVLLYRYFNVDKEYMSYDYEFIIVSLIEDILSKDKMTKLYFNGNLYGFVMELQKYNSKDNIIDFIVDMDCLYVLLDHIKKYRDDIVYYHNKISKFVLDTYRTMLLDSLCSKRICIEEYNIKLDECIEKLHMAFEVLDIDDIKVKRRLR